MPGTAPHTPVLCESVQELLITSRSGLYIDGTIGFGGHAGAILGQLDGSGRLIGLDWDSQAIAFCQKRFDSELQNSRITLFHRSYRDFTDVLEILHVEQIDGFLLDLGISSYDIEQSGRGFSYSKDEPLDMRFNPEEGLPAREFLKTLKERDISRILARLGEEPAHKKIAGEIVSQLNRGTLETSMDLSRAVEAVIPNRFLKKTLSRVFQAIRIAVNHELENVQETLEKLIPVLKPGGRLAVISFHSLEDRIVKRFFRDQALDCVCPPELPVCQCSQVATLKPVTRRAVQAGEDEISKNPRARSARLRVAERI